MEGNLITIIAAVIAAAVFGVIGFVLGQAHRKHAYQLMANELKIGHVKVASLYMVLQLAVSLGFIYLCPESVVSHWIYLAGAVVVLGLAYLLFKRKYYHLHEEYLRSLDTGR